MRMTAILLASAAGLAALVLQIRAGLGAKCGRRFRATVSSAKEGAMEGVVVSARKDGSTITVSVISDDKGHFSFPASRLDPGHYAIGIRAVGYDLDGPKDATVAAGQEDKIDVTLKPARNLGAQLTNAEWLMSMPGTDDAEAVRARLQQLPHAGTHRAFDSRCRRVSAGVPAHGRLLSRQHAAQAAAAGRRRGAPAHFRRRSAGAAEWLASINLSQQDTWAGRCKTLPRLTGKSTHVIITEYDMPNKLIEPHDVVLDHEGNVWYSDFGQMFLGEMDPKTGAGHAISDPRHQARLFARHARSAKSTRTTIRGSA